MQRVSPQCPDTARLEQKGRPAVKRLARPALCKGPQDVAVGDDQHVAVCALLILFPHDGGVPFLPDLFDQPVKPGRNVGGTPARN